MDNSAETRLIKNRIMFNVNNLSIKIHISSIL